MDKTELTKIYERLYFHELDRRDKIAARQATPLGALVGLIAIIAFLLNNKPAFPTQHVAASFWLTLGATVIALAIGAWHFRVSWLAHNERHVATAAEIDDYHNQLEAHYAREHNASELVDREFSNYLLDTYRRSATTNAQNNDSRSDSLHKAGTWLTIAACLSLMTTIPYYLGKGTSHDGQEASSATPAPTAAAP